MAQYDTITSQSYPQPMTARPESPVVGALRNLGEATHSLASATDAYIAARDEFHMAQKRLEEARNIVVKEQEQAGV